MVLSRSQFDVHMQFIIFLSIFLAGFLTIPNTVLFYDQPEYLKIISTHSFWQVFSLGHFPIHPIFLAVLWLVTKFIPANWSALLFGTVSVFVFYKIAKIIFKKGLVWLSVLLFVFLPGVWLINTNLMTQSLQLTLYLLSIFFLLRKMKKSFFLAVFLMMGVDIGSIVWLPTVFLFPIIFDKEIKYDRKAPLRFIKIAAISVLFSFLFYGFIYFFIRKDFSGSTEQIFAYSSIGILRMVRNIWFSFIYSFGSLTPFILAFLLIKNVKSRHTWIAWMIFFVVVSVLGAFWGADLMMRRIVFAGVLISLALYKYLGRKLVLMILYLIPIIVANGILYLRSNPDTLSVIIQRTVDPLPKDQVLIQTRYLRPFTEYKGTVLWMGDSDLGKIDYYLNSGKRVFLTKQAVTAPYLLLVGNNYHITSVGKVGDSESRFLFKKYAVEPYGSDLELKLFNGPEVSTQAGEPVVFYDQSFWGRLARRRIDYGDVGFWIWAIITNHRDPTGWTYKDVRGIWYNM